LFYSPEGIIILVKSTFPLLPALWSLWPEEISVLILP